jgi:hypothetical protein
MQWTSKPVTRSKEKKRVSLKKEREKSHKVTLNALTVRNKNITQKTVTRNPNKTERLRQRVSPKIKKKNPNRKSIPEKSEMKPDDNLRKKLFLE